MDKALPLSSINSKSLTNPILKMNPTQLPIHFKKPGRSYNQIGRKGNVALYSVYSDYLTLPDLAWPYILIGFELVAIKTNRAGTKECYPKDQDFGKSAWSIPKSWSRIRSPRPRCSPSVVSRSGCSTPQTLLDRSPTSQASACLATSPPQTN